MNKLPLYEKVGYAMGVVMAMMPFVIKRLLQKIWLLDALICKYKFHEERHLFHIDGVMQEREISINLYAEAFINF